jgi:nitrous oxide reductase accessory protein NosL
MASERSYIDRRTALKTLAPGAVLLLAGCAGDGTDGESTDEGEDTENEGADGNGDGTDGESTDEGEDTENEGADGTDEGDGAETQLLEPTEVPEGGECAVCNMIAAEYPAWNAQLAHEDETRTYFCSSGCMSAYYVAPGEFDAPDSPIAAVWVTEYETGELIDASEAYFVRVSDPDHVDDVMMMNPTPFADRAGAEAFIEQFDAYSDEDIITLEAFDRELAMQYRAKFLEGESDD